MQGLKKSDQKLSSIDHKERLFLLRDMFFASDSLFPVQRGLFNAFYKNSLHFFEVKTEDFELVVNPFMDFSIGQETEEDKLIFLNKRGIEFWGKLDQRFYFYSAIHENQSNFFNYIDKFIEKYKTIPGQGHYKSYQSSIINSFNGFDYANAQAYLGYKISKHGLLEIGHGNHFIGNGQRSLLLSNFSHNYFYLRMNIKVWLLEYQTLFAELSSISSRQTVNNVLLPKKYMAVHYLSFKPSPRFELGLFETVVFSREDHFEFQYLNPMILYRTVEALLDSPDNVLLGLNVNWHFAKGASVYGQLLLDELKTSEIFSSDGWWGNKFAYQLGIKYFNVLSVDQLDAQLEYNMVRPYTYSHNVNSKAFPSTSVSSFSHFNQALAHPLGANFSEVILSLRYRPIYKLRLNLQYLHSKVGRDNNGNYGSDILLNNTSRISDYGIEHLQGAKSTISMIDFSISYECFDNFFIDGYLKLRTEENKILENINTNYFGLGIRYNIVHTKIDY
jgi:hypothetical protein